MERFWFVGILLTGLFSLSITMAENLTVRVGLARLQPADISITVGETVTFYNQDLMPGGHTIVAIDKSFKSPPLAKNKSWSRTFEKEGIYAYRIKEHPEVIGRIVVLEKP